MCPSTPTGITLDLCRGQTSPPQVDLEFSLSRSALSSPCCSLSRVTVPPAAQPSFPSLTCSLSVGCDESPSLPLQLGPPPVHPLFPQILITSLLSSCTSLLTSSLQSCFPPPVCPTCGLQSCLPKTHVQRHDFLLCAISLLPKAQKRDISRCLAQSSPWSKKFEKSWV